MLNFEQWICFRLHRRTLVLKSKEFLPMHWIILQLLLAHKLTQDAKQLLYGAKNGVYPNTNFLSSGLSMHALDGDLKF